MSEYLMYLRKSRQDDPNETVEEVLKKHEIQLQDYALMNFKYRIPEQDIYREVVSGETIDDRPMINAVISRIQSENIKGVIVIDPQRLTRGDMLDCGTIVHMFRYTQTLIITPPKTYNLTDKYDRKFFEMELSRGSDYLEYTKEILERGRKASVRRGNFINSVPPYGYTKIKDGKTNTLAINEDEALYVRMIFDMYADGYGIQAICVKLDEAGAKPRNCNNFVQSTVKQILVNPVYIGKLKMSERERIKVVEDGKIVTKRIRKPEYEIVDGKHPAIVSEEVYNKVQERFGTHSRERDNAILINPYASIMKCEKCGKSITYMHYKHRENRLDCRNFRCDNVSHRFDEVNDAIIAQLKATLHDFEVKIDESSSEGKSKRNELITSLRKRLDDNAKKMNSICDFLEKGIYTTDMFISRKKVIEDEKADIEKALKNVEHQDDAKIDVQNKIASLHQAIDMLSDDTISAKTKNDFLKSFIKIITYRKEKDGNIYLNIFLK